MDRKLKGRKNKGSKIEGQNEKRAENAKGQIIKNRKTLKIKQSMVGLQF